MFVVVEGTWCKQGHKSNKHHNKLHNKMHLEANEIYLSLHYSGIKEHVSYVDFN